MKFIQLGSRLFAHDSTFVGLFLKLGMPLLFWPNSRFGFGSLQVWFWFWVGCWWRFHFLLKALFRSWNSFPLLLCFFCLFWMNRVCLVLVDDLILLSILVLILGGCMLLCLMIHDLTHDLSWMNLKHSALLCYLSIALSFFFLVMFCLASWKFWGSKGYAS